MHKISEAETRKQMIDPALERAGWSLKNQTRRLALADLYAEPFGNFRADAVERWFSNEEIEEIIQFVDRVTV